MIKTMVMDYRWSHITETRFVPHHISSMCWVTAFLHDGEYSCAVSGMKRFQVVGRSGSAVEVQHHFHQVEGRDVLTRMGLTRRCHRPDNVPWPVSFLQA